MRCVCRVEPGEGVGSRDIGNRAKRKVFRSFDSVDQVLARCELPKTPQLACRQVQGDKHCVDQRRGGLEEIVVVRGKELTHLVDEQYEAHTTHNSCNQLPCPCEQRKHHSHGSHHS